MPLICPAVPFRIGRDYVLARSLNSHQPPFNYRRGDSILERDIAREFLLRDHTVAIDIDIVEACFKVDIAADFFDRESGRNSWRSFVTRARCTIFCATRFAPEDLRLRNAWGPVHCVGQRC